MFFHLYKNLYKKGSTPAKAGAQPRYTCRYRLDPRLRGDGIFSSLLFVAALCIPIVAHAEPIPLQSYVYGNLPTTGQRLWVAPTGSDVTGLGTQARPYATPGVASLHAMPGDTIVLKTGTYPSFGSLRRSGTEERPIVVRPEPNGYPHFVLQGSESALEIAASHLQVFGVEITRVTSTLSSAACVRVTRPVENILLRDFHVHDCGTGIQLFQPSVSVRRLTIQDSEFVRMRSFGIVCDGGVCEDVHLRRVQVRDLLNHHGGGAALYFGVSSTRITIEETSVLETGGDAVIALGLELLVTNLTVSSSGASPLSRAVVFGQGGTLLNSDIRTSGSGVFLVGGASYRLRGNLIRSGTTNAEGHALRVGYGPAEADRPGVLLLDGNRIMTRAGRVGLPTSLPGLSAPLLTTLKSNTFFFDDVESGADLVGQFAVATSVSSATGTGIINLGGNISVVGDPEPDDLLSPIFQSSRTQPNLWSGGVMVFPGARLKGSGPTVYLYAADGARHAFPSLAVYRSWFPDFRDVTEISDEAMSKISLGRNVTYRPGVRLVKVTTDPKVYAIGAGHTLRWIKTEEVAKTLFGAEWARQVDDIPDAFFINYQMGDPIERADQYHPDQERAQAVNPAEG